MKRRLAAIFIATLFLLGYERAIAPAMWSSDGAWVRTRQDDERIILALASRTPTIGVVYLLKSASDTRVLLQKIASLGGHSIIIDRRIDYVRATVPTSAARQALEVPNGDVAAIDLDLSFYQGLAAIKPGDWAKPPKDTARIQAEIALSKAIMRAPTPILHDLGADAWRQQHPTFDGRGVNVAIVDAMLDPQVPELSGARALDGRPIRKIAGMHIISLPGEHSAQGADMAGSQWVDMHAQVAGRNTVSYAGRNYRLPHPGRFHIGIFDFFNVANNTHWLNPVIFGSALGDGKYAVLWETSTGRVWVDVSRTRDFRRARAMRDYNLSGDWSHFGFWHSAAYPLLHPSVSFVVLPDPQRQMVAIGLGIGTHALGVATSTAGSPVGPDDPVHGVAPAAQVDSFEYGTGPSVHSQAEVLISAFEDPKVDLIVYEWSSYVHSSDEEGWFLQALCERLVRTFDKALFVPGDNSPQLGSISEQGLGDDVISVGASQSAASYELYEGFRPATNDHKHHGGLTDGPGQDGSLKPDLMAPSGWIAAVQSYFWDEFAQRKPGLYTLPAGFWDFGGTSQATPTAGGAAALLLSAARQSGLHVGGIELTNAMRLGARQSANLTAIDQGNGLINIAASWKILQAQGHHPNPYVRRLAVVCGGSVRTAQWPNGAPNGGRGIFETVGWHPGDLGMRSMRFCLPSPVGTLHASLLLNDGTFGIAGIQQSAGIATVSVGIHPKRAGFHSALVQIADGGGRVIGRGMVGIAAAAPLDARNGYTTTQQVLVPRPGWTTTWVDVPAGTDALTITVDRDVPVGVELQDPSGIVRAGATAFGVFATHNVLTMPAPSAGAWEILLLDRHDVVDHTRELLPVEPAVATVKVQAVRANRTASSATSVYANVPIREIGSVQTLVTQNGQFPSRDPVLIPITVPANTDALYVNLSGSDPRVDAYLLDCNHGPCAMISQTWGSEPDKRMTTAPLLPGHYVLALDDYEVGQNAAGLPNYHISVQAYDHVGTGSSSGGHAYEVQCQPNAMAILSAPQCGLFMTSP